MIKVHRPVVNDFGGAPVAEHDYACPVFQSQHAVLDLSTGVFHPSWQARAEGFVLLRVRSRRILELMEKLFPARAPEFPVTGKGK